MYWPTLVRQYLYDIFRLLIIEIAVPYSNYKCIKIQYFYKIQNVIWCLRCSWIIEFNHTLAPSCKYIYIYILQFISRKNEVKLYRFIRNSKMFCIREKVVYISRVREKTGEKICLELTTVIYPTTFNLNYYFSSNTKWNSCCAEFIANS